MRTFLEVGVVALLLVVGLGAAGYAAHAVATWFLYGRPCRATRESEDPLLDRVMPAYDVAERHHIRVSAPAPVTLAAASEADVMQSPITRAIFRARDLLLGSDPDSVARPRGLLALTKSIGWGVLAAVPGREVVMGAVTQPWEPNVTFRALSPEEFSAFNEPGFVKIAWTLRADPIGPADSVFRTETRVIATDVTARERFRRYWTLLSPGIVIIRWLMLRPVRREAERRQSHATGGRAD